MADATSNGALSYLFNGSAPSGVDTSAAASNGMPTWYQQYLSGIAGKATQIAGAQDNVAVPTQNVAGFNPDQQQAFQQVRANQGAWQPDVNAATSAASSIQPTANGLVGQAQTDVAGPAQSWGTDQAQKYMSPYTSQVVDNIQRLGMRNLTENLVPAVQDQFLGSGQFGSTRNADILGRTVRDASTDINGQVSNALNSGYTNAQTAFTADANRAQQQQQMQGSAALQGASVGATAGQQAATTLGALGQATQNMGNTDAATLNATGTQQQQLNQADLNAQTNNQTTQNNFDWNNLNNLNSVVRGLPLPTTTATAVNSPSTPTSGLYGGSGVSQVGALTSALK